MSQKYPPYFILASASPRRRQLLEESGYKFKIVHPDIDETAYSTDQIDPCKYAEQLALAKAKSVARKRFPAEKSLPPSGVSIDPTIAKPPSLVRTIECKS